MTYIYLVYPVEPEETYFYIEPWRTYSSRDEAKKWIEIQKDRYKKIEKLKEQVETNTFLHTEDNYPIKRTKAQTILNEMWNHFRYDFLFELEQKQFNKKEMKELEHTKPQPAYRIVAKRLNKI